MAAEAARVVTVCTGNVARSPTLAAMLSALTGAPVESRGTHVIEGLGVSSRTLAAFVAATGGEPGPLRAHRSRQLTAGDLAHADLVLCAEAGHVAAVRVLRSDTPVALVGQLARATGGLADRLAATSLPDTAFDVPDPGDGDAADYEFVAELLWAHAREIAPLL